MASDAICIRENAVHLALTPFVKCLWSLEVAGFVAVRFHAGGAYLFFHRKKGTSQGTVLR